MKDYAKALAEHPRWPRLATPGMVVKHSGPGGDCALAVVYEVHDSFLLIGAVDAGWSSWGIAEVPAHTCVPVLSSPVTAELLLRNLRGVPGFDFPPGQIHNGEALAAAQLALWGPP